MINGWYRPLKLVTSGHFFAIILPQMGQNAAKTGQQISRMLPPNVANVAAKRHERCRIAVTSTPWNYHFHAMELPPPPHGTTCHPAPSAHFPAACQPLACRQVGQKKFFYRRIITRFWPIFVMKSVKKWQEVTSFRGTCHFLNIT